MGNTSGNQREVLVISATESFLAKSLVSKMETEGIVAGMSHGEIKAIVKRREQVEFFILFMNENVEDMAETLVYLKDIASDLDRKIILIGEPAQHDIVCRTIPEKSVKRLS